MTPPAASGRMAGRGLRVPGGVSFGRPTRIALAVGSGLLLVLVFPGADQGWLAWVALVPLLLACHGVRPGFATALGFAAGGVAAVGIHHWMFEVPAFGLRHAFVLGPYLAAYPAAWCAALALLAPRRLPLLAAAPALWVAVEYVRAHAGFLAAPWATLAHSQHANLALLQTAAVAGEPGVSFLVVLGNAAVARLVVARAWREAALAAVVIGAVHLAGAVALAGTPDSPSIRATAVQPSLLRGERLTPEGYAATLDRLERLTRAAADREPALIAWPETAVRNLASDAASAARLRNLADETRATLVAGASETAKFVADGGARSGAYNAAYVVRPGQAIGRPYHKVRLVPFAEYLPAEGLLRWPTWLVPASFPSLAGGAPRRFTLPDGTPFAVIICWENLFADLTRAAVRDGARLLVQLTNDNWFERTAAPRQHNLASVLRAVETGSPVVVASNTGPSLVIDGQGRVVAEVPVLFSEGAATADVALRGPGLTPYARGGDGLALALVAAATAALVPMTGTRRDRKGENR